MTATNPTDLGDTVSVRARLELYRASLTAAELRVAEFILASPAEAIQLDISSLGQTCRSSEATVSRLCRKLGFSGFRAFRLSLAQDLAGAEPSEPSATSIDASVAAIAKAIGNAYQRTLADTAELINGGAIDTVCVWLAAARRIHVYGSGGSFVVASDIAHKLLRLGLPATALNDGDTITATSSLAGPGDVLIGVSLSGRTREVVMALERGRTQGASTVAITHDPASPIAKIAEKTLLGAAASNDFCDEPLSGRLGQLLIADLLYVLLSMRHIADGPARVGQVQANVNASRLSGRAGRQVD